MKKLPPYQISGQPVAAQVFNDLLDYARGLRLRPGPGYRLKETAGGTVLVIQPGDPGGGVVGSAAVIEDFGGLVRLASGNQAIKGGAIYCGDTTFTIPEYDLGATPANGTVYAYVSLAATANIDDDGELLLPGVETSTSTSPVMQVAASYPSGVNPTPASPTGTVIVAIGQVVTADNVPTFYPASVGFRKIDHYAGTYYVMGAGVAVV
jgi:hypothetical protein